MEKFTNTKTSVEGDYVHVEGTRADGSVVTASGHAAGVANAKSPLHAQNYLNSLLNSKSFSEEVMVSVDGIIEKYKADIASLKESLVKVEAVAEKLASVESAKVEAALVAINTAVQKFVDMEAARLKQDAEKEAARLALEARSLWQKLKDFFTGK